MSTDRCNNGCHHLELPSPAVEEGNSLLPPSRSPEPPPPSYILRYLPLGSQLFCFPPNLRFPPSSRTFRPPPLSPSPPAPNSAAISPAPPSGKRFDRSRSNSGSLGHLRCAGSCSIRATGCRLCRRNVIGCAVAVGGVLNRSRNSA
ncbi:hypothetical protein DAI22_12g185050 [Oryza sativa Japonica Group]|nr:hypothetical protein DAI22_12g185050 [Oryza sativa Japonica Group]